MDVLLNYIVIGFIFAFIIDYMLTSKSFKNHSKTQNTKWGWDEKILAVVIWPIGIIIFLIAFVKQFFKK
tara:strand:- start:27 stop:233 length:207 start_codon:yes stop_codon:yes gene_type:complete